MASGFAFHPHLQAAIGKPCIDPVAGLRIADTAHHAAIGVLQDRVAARDRRQRADRFKRTRQPAQAQGVVLQAADDRGLRTRGEYGQAVAQYVQAPLWLHRAQHRQGMAQARKAAVVLRTPYTVQALAGVLLAHLHRLQARLWTQCTQSQGGAVGALHGVAQAVQMQGLQALLQAAQAGEQVDTVGRQ